MIGDDGMPRAELFINDGLHLSDAGYKVWSDLVRPHLAAR
jgi:lysophospholipase L1-like esterase